jgi:hypothetical protein
VSKTLIQAIAIAAMLLSPTLASARMGSGSVSTQVGSHVGSGGVVRAEVKPAPMPPRIQSNVKMLKCHQYPRGNGQGGVIYVMVCN